MSRLRLLVQLSLWMCALVQHVLASAMQTQPEVACTTAAVLDPQHLPKRVSQLKHLCMIAIDAYRKHGTMLMHKACLMVHLVQGMICAVLCTRCFAWTDPAVG